MGSHVCPRLICMKLQLGPKAGNERGGTERERERERKRKEKKFCSYCCPTICFANFEDSGETLNRTALYPKKLVMRSDKKRLYRRRVSALVEKE